MDRRLPLRPTIEIIEESIETLGEHDSIPIAYEYDRVLELTLVDDGHGGLLLSERQLEVPVTKNYDDHEKPSNWSHRFDLSNWGFLVARADGKRVGGAVIAFDCAELDMLDGRSDLAVLWDIRIAPEFRGRGIGTLLFQAVEKWASERRCTQLRIETQSNNYGACRFYAQQGCVVGVINRLAYKDLPNEVQILWYKALC